MRLGIDAAFIGQNRSGNEVYTRGIIQGLGRVLDPTRDALLLAGDCRATLETIDAGPVPAKAILIHRGLRGEVTLGRALARAGAQGILASYNAPLGFRGQVATVVHDVAYARVPQTYPTLLRRRLDISVRRSLRISGVIVTVSEFSKAELLDVYPQARPERVVVAPNGVSPRFRRESINEDDIEAVKKRYQLPAEFVLTVGNLQPRKNVPRLAEATRRLDVPLVVAGQRLWRSAEVEGKLGAGVTWLGYVADEHLPALYAASTVFAYPSLYEGFGLPVIEAMAAGVPVATSNRTGTKEVAGRAAALFDPESVDSIHDMLGQVLGSKEARQRLQADGVARAAEFTWDRGALRIAECFGAV